MAFVEAFLNGALSTLLIGVLAKLVAIFFASDHSARIGAFCVALGYTLRRYSYGGPANEEAAVATTAAFGSLLALLVLWLWLLKKRTVGQSTGID